MINVIGNTRTYDGNAKNDKDRIFGIDGIGGALRGSDYKDPLKIAVSVMTTDCTVYTVWYPKYECYIAIRKLTPKEYFRLQGWTDDYFEKAKFVNSDSQLYKQAGNGVTVTVIEVIARKLSNGRITNEHNQGCETDVQRHTQA